MNRKEAEMPEYKVLRQHDGDKQYWEGDKRELSAADAKQLVDLGVLKEVKAKAETAPQNKAEPAPANKSISALDHDSNGRRGGAKKAS
jgi:hypothetical protein